MRLRGLSMAFTTLLAGVYNCNYRRLAIALREKCVTSPPRGEGGRPPQSTSTSPTTLSEARPRGIGAAAPSTK